MKKLKNKKGFTLIEIIVVLVIVGIMIAIAVPAVLGYVDKAKEAQAMTEGQAGYLASQAITVKAKASNNTLTDAQIQTKINTASEMKDALGSDSTSIKTYFCKVSATKDVEGCSFTTKSSKTNRYINITANSDTTVTDTPLYKNTDGTLVTVPTN